MVSMRDYIVHHTKLFLDHQTHIHRAPAKDGQRAVRDPNDASRCSWSIGLAFWYAPRGFVRVHTVKRSRLETVEMAVLFACRIFLLRIYCLFQSDVECIACIKRRQGLSASFFCRKY